MLLLGLATTACGSRDAPRTLAQVADCPLADPLLEDLPAPTRSSIETPFRHARIKPYAQWNEYDRGIVARYLQTHFPALDEPTVLSALFTGDPPTPPTPFKQWLQLEGFSPAVGEFLLRNYTTVDEAEAARRVREELARWPGGPRFQEWLALASSMDPSPSLTHYVLDLHLAQGMHLTEGIVGGCRYGAWCHERLNADTSAVEQATYLRESADRGKSALTAFNNLPAIFASDPEGFSRDARREDLRGMVAAELLIASGDQVRTEAFLRDESLPIGERAFWANQLALDPAPGTEPLLVRLRNDEQLPAIIRRAMNAPGTVAEPYTSCRERVRLLEGDL